MAMVDSSGLVPRGRPLTYHGQLRFQHPRSHPVESVLGPNYPEHSLCAALLDPDFLITCALAAVCPGHPEAIDRSESVPALGSESAERASLSWLSIRPNG